MNLAGSERAENNKGFDCKNMGDVLGKECEKEEPLTRSVEDVLREEAEGAASSGAASESDSDKDLSADSDEDLSWLIPINTIELGAKKCKCEGCLKLFESYNNDKKNAKLLLSSWKEFRNYIRNVYLKSPFEFAQKNETISMKNNEKLHEIIQVMRLCDPYQLFQKIEDELCSMVLESRIRQLNLLKDKNNPALAEEFITGLIAEYVKLLTSALQLSPAIENLLGPQLQKFGLTWEVLNKQLYRSLVYNHFDVQQNLVRFIEQLRKMLPFKDDIYHELVHQYLALDREMTLIGTMWKNVEPLIQEYRNLKSKENEKLNNLLDAMKDFFANKLCSGESDLEKENGMEEKIPCSASEDESQYCPNCMTRQSCTCDECTVTHMMSCADILLGMESPLGTNTPSRSRSRSPIKQNDVDIKNVGKEDQREEEQSCECHACTLPPTDLMDCSVAFDQSRIQNNTRGEGFQLYPHIHGTTSEAEDMSNIYDSLQKNTDFVYPHLYNLHNQANSSGAESHSQKSNLTRPQIKQVKVNSNTTLQSQSSTSVLLPSSSSQESASKVKSPPATLSNKDSILKKEVDPSAEKLKRLAAVKKSIEQTRPNESFKESDADKNKIRGSKITGKKSDIPVKAVAPKQKDPKVEKTAVEKPQMKAQVNAKANGCVISGVCGKCCLKHGTNCLKMPGCHKGIEKNSSTVVRSGISSNSNARMSQRYVGGKDDLSHKTAKSHLFSKPKPQDSIKKAASKKSLELDEYSSHEDSCSEGSASTPVSVQKESRHCDCCYCEVFGHGVPSVAPLSRNYQETRERLRLRLSMKKSGNCKTVPPGQNPQQTSQKVAGSHSKPQPNSLATQGSKKEAINELDIESLLKYIEGGKKDDGKDAKKAAKRARQKQKKQKEKEREREREREKEKEKEREKEKEKEKQKEEAERKRLEVVKNQVTISLVNNNKRNQNAKPNLPPPKQLPPPSQRYQPQTLNLSGLKSLVEKSDPNAVPKMVTIRRVMAPFSTEPTVTITLKGSTPDKDKVLFMLKNGNEAVPPETKKSKKKKAKQVANIYEEECASLYEPQASGASKKKKKKGKNEENEIVKKIEVNRTLKYSVPENFESKSKKSKNPKTVENSMTQNIRGFSAATKKAAQKSVPANKINSSSSSSVLLNSKTNSQKSVQTLKVQSRNIKNKQSTQQQTNKNNSGLGKKGVQSQSNSKVNVKNNGSQSSKSKNSTNKSSSNGKNSNNGNSCSKTVSTTKNVNNNKITSNNKNAVGNKNKKNSSQSICQNSENDGSKKSKCDKIKSVGVSDVKKTVSKNKNGSCVQNQKGKKEKTQTNVTSSSANQKQGKKQKKETVQSVSVQQKKNKSGNKANNINENAPPQKNMNLDILKKLQNKQRLPNLEISRAPDISERPNKKLKSNIKASMQDVEVNVKGPAEKYDRGKVIINTPSYRLSEVLSSIAPSPPPKEEINLENLRLPPGITITKIEGPIAKPVKPPVHQAQVPKPSPPIVMSTPILKPNPPPGNVIVVDTGRLKEVMKENSQISVPIPPSAGGKKKKKKNKQQAMTLAPPMELPLSQSKFGPKMPKNCALNKGPMSVLSGLDPRRMVPNLENQQATIIKTSNNMVTIRSPALQQAMNIHAYQTSQAYKSGMNGYSGMNLFSDEVNRINYKMGKMKLSPDADDRLTRQMHNLNIKGGGSREKGSVTQALISSSSSSSQNCQVSSKKKKKKKKGKSGDDREVEPVESVFQPKDIDLENGDIDDDERELEAFKRFCLQSVPSERKNKVKVNLNIKDIVLKKKSSGIGCN